MAHEPLERGHHPSALEISDTPYASPEDRPLRSFPQPTPLHLSKQTVQSSESIIPRLPSPRSERSQSLAVQSTSPALHHPIKRKPLSSTASPLATKYSFRDHLEILSDQSAPRQRFTRSFSVDSPTLHEFPEGIASLDSPAVSPREEFGQDPLLRVSLNSSGLTEPDSDAGGLESQNIPAGHPAALQTDPTASRSQHAEDRDLDSDLIHAADDSPTSTVNSNTNNTMSLVARKPTPPHLNLSSPVDTGIRATAFDYRANTQKPPPKSPGSSKFGTFFGWSPSSTEFSFDKAEDKGFSPLPSPFSPKPTTIFTDASPISSQGIFTAKTNATEGNPLGYCESYLQTPPPVTPSPPLQIEEMEDELKAISAELAGSIRREMDLEDLVDRMQAEINNPQAPGKRTSDYFSDSGYSSAKFSDYDATKEEIAQVQRRAEQEKAQIRLELTDKLAVERSKRKELDQQIKELATRASNLDLAQTRSQDASGRARELENTCEDLRRRLSEERQVKNNFEDLLSALKTELQTAANERDNLRDEIVPQLRARVEGLEAQASDHTKLTYESTKIQQELNNLKVENQTLRNSQSDVNRMSVSRLKSNSVSGQQPFRLQQAPLSRSNTVKQTESREALAERLRDVEAQRDALHSALKNLLERQEFQNRENDKKIKVLETERERIMTSSGFEKEVSNLRHEISHLRRRAEEAMEQKWQVEKGLGGLKMDLDRAEEEIASLRSLLKERDILIPSAFARSSSSSSGSTGHLDVPVTSASLEKAYKELQRSYANALERIKSLELGTTAGVAVDEKTKLAMTRLEQSLSSSVSERDMARQEASTYQAQLDNLQTTEKKHLQSEHDLASQLRESARRVEELAQQVSSQLAANANLRTRLSDTVARGESEQKANKERITGMQARLRTLEDQLIATQTAAEDRIAKHEEEVTALKEAQSSQLQRLRDSANRSPRHFPANAPLSPMFANGTKSPLLSPRPSPRRSTTMPVGESEKEQLAQIETLQARVAELEKALTAAEGEMQEVVSRMNTAQIEVLQLQEEREAAARETRKLQRQIETEKVNSFEQRFKMLSTNVAT